MLSRGPVLLRSRLGLQLALLLAVAGACSRSGFAQPPAPAKVALLVGVNQYEKRYLAERPLQFAERDVEHMAQELGKQGFTVKLLKGSLTGADKATRSNIEAALAELLTGRSSTDLVLIGFAGHGQQLPLRNEKGEVLTDSAGRQMEEAYYCPVDATFTEAASMVGLTTLVQTLDVKGGINLVLVDACRDNPDTSRGIRSISGNELNGRLPRNTAVMFSCSAGQQALETDKAGGGHGVFFHHVLQGLQGEAKNARGEVTWSRLVEFVTDNTDPQAKEWFPDRAERAVSGRVQTPHRLENLTVNPVLAKYAIAPVVIPPVNPAPSPNPAPNNIPPSNGNSPPLFDATAGRSESDAQAAQQAWAKHIGQPVEIKNAIDMKLKLIPPGEFLMGTPDSEIDRILAAAPQAKREDYKDEQPQHRVRNSQPFYIGIHEVTQSQYQAVMAQTPSGYKAGGTFSDYVKGIDTRQFPVESTSWYDAIEFCNKLSEKEGLLAYYELRTIQRKVDVESLKQGILVDIKGGPGYRLPTEAEWEYACRAGTLTLYSFGNEISSQKANFEGSKLVAGPYFGRTTIVGSYGANAFGLFDMHGNVHEWCFDLHSGLAYSSRKDVTVDPVYTRGDSEYESVKVLRGGDSDSKIRARSAARLYESAMGATPSTGFRIARSLK